MTKVVTESWSNNDHKPFKKCILHCLGYISGLIPTPRPQPQLSLLHVVNGENHILKANRDEFI